ncbi:MAG: TIGR03915 family putative DNA repair protein, partial [Candidatus Coproplasma sp.]
MTYYITDGSEDCFYTAVFNAYKDEDCIITSQGNVQLGLGYELIEVETDGQKAERVKRKLNSLDAGALNDIKLILRSCDALKENIAFAYVKLIVKNGGAVRNMQADPRVLEATDTISKVTGETHRMKGFLRFMENSDGVLYAPYSPDNDITDMLSVHFAERLGGQKFVIHDVK